MPTTKNLIFFDMKIETILPLGKFNWNFFTKSDFKKKNEWATAKCNYKSLKDISSLLFAIDLQIQFVLSDVALISCKNIIRIDKCPICRHKGCCASFGWASIWCNFNLIAYFQSTKLYPRRRFGRAQFSRSTVFSNQRFLRPFFPMLYQVFLRIICLSIFDSFDFN